MNAVYCNVLGNREFQKLGVHLYCNGKWTFTFECKMVYRLRQMRLLVKLVKGCVGGSIYRLSPTLVLPQNQSSFLHYSSCTISDMSQHSSTFPFQVLFNTALQDYESQTGTRLIDHPLAKKLESCNSVDSINVILQEQARIFHEFRGDDGKLMKSLKCSVGVLYTLSVSTLFGEGIGLVCTKAFIEVHCS